MKPGMPKSHPRNPKEKLSLQKEHPKKPVKTSPDSQIPHRILLEVTLRMLYFQPPCHGKGFLTQSLQASHKERDKSAVVTENKHCRVLALAWNSCISSAQPQSHPAGIAQGYFCSLGSASPNVGRVQPLSPSKEFVATRRCSPLQPQLLFFRGIPLFPLISQEKGVWGSGDCTLNTTWAAGGLS